MTNASIRIQEYLKLKGVSNYKFCKDLGFSSSFVRNGTHIGSDKASKILNHYPDLNPEWLITGKGDMLRGTSGDIDSLDPKKIKKVVGFLLDNQPDLLKSELFIDFLKDCNREIELKKIVEDTESKIKQAKETLLKKINKFQE
ncbi:hypothetical protein ACFSTE_04020 [Aquimarina hainanensis]|uniref:XRE family transcriptional regulator n=1 Tax=Aquimarina hainanensis TaxID=1578017 RepID=A0ABW5N5W4_9FLAO